jgi:hypothetical protein
MWIVQQIREEPVMLQGLVQASIALLAGFQVFSATQEQMGYIMAFVAALLAFLTRRAVSPVVSSAKSDRELPATGQAEASSSRSGRAAT